MPILNLKFDSMDFTSNKDWNTPDSVDVTLSYNNSILDAYATNVYDTVLNIGEKTGVAQTYRGLIKPNWSLIPAGHRISKATLSITPITDNSSNDRTMRAYRCLRNVVSAQATWNIFSTGNNWGTAGCSNSTTDYDGAVELGNMSVLASETLNVAKTMSLNIAEIQKFYDGTYPYGWIFLKMDTENNDNYAYAPLDHATVAYRPKIVIEYIP